MHVLLVEDQAPDMTVQRRMVEKALPLANIHEAMTLHEAREALQRFKFDLVVLDLNLGDNQSTGVELVDAVRRNGDAAIIVISGMDVETYRPMMFQSKVWDYFEKPIDLASLCCVVERILETRSGASLPRSTPRSTLPPGLRWDDPMTDDPLWQGRRVMGLAHGERKVLRLLSSFPNAIVPYSDFFDLSDRWDDDSAKLKRSLTSMMSKLRGRFLEIDPDFDRIEGRSNQGYIWRVDART